MTNFEFQEVFSLLGKKTDDPSAREFFENIHKNYKDFFIVHEPFEENIEKENDNWKTYDSEELGITIEVLGDLVISVSFSRGGTFYNEPQEIHAYPYPLYNGLRLETNQEEIRAEMGAPEKEGDFFDQYQIDENITMGIIYNSKDNSVNTVSYGITEIFSDPEKYPNRFSFIFISLS